MFSFHKILWFSNTLAHEEQFVWNRCFWSNKLWEAEKEGTRFSENWGPDLSLVSWQVVVNASSRLTLSYYLKTYLTNTPNSTVFKFFVTTGRNGVNLKGQDSYRYGWLFSTSSFSRISFPLWVSNVNFFLFQNWLYLNHWLILFYT